MSNPRKFSEKIALHNQKQAEETAAFERIMQEVSVTRVIGMQPPRMTSAHLSPHPQAYLRSYLGGSLPNVNQIAANPQIELHHQGGFDDGKHAMRHPGRFDSRMRPYTHRRNVMPFEMNNRHRISHFEGNPAQYAGPFLSPPPESSWRSFALSRTNSDSALHQSVMNPNQQDPFNSANNQMNHQPHREFNENSFYNLPPSYKTMLENKKLEQQLHSANRPKSCEAPTMNMLSSGEPSIHGPPDGHGNQIPIIPVSVSPSLSHVTQIGNNTGSLPDLTNLHIPSPLSNPIDYDEAHQHQTSQNNVHPPVYNQARSTGNLPAASAISPHLGGIPRGPASPSRSRRHTHNGPSPLSLGSPEHARRIKYPKVSSPKMGTSEIKSPPRVGNCAYPYPTPQGTHPGHHNPTDSRGWPLPSPDHPGSPSHVQSMSPRGVALNQQGQQGNIHQRHLSQQHGGSQQLQIDVSAASKVGQPHLSRVVHGTAITSPLTSPTSPTSQCSQASFSPVTSPRHEFTTGSNPALSEAYYRNDMTMQPLQHQFEHFHVVNDAGNNPQHQGIPPPGYSGLSALVETSSDGSYEIPHGNSGSVSSRHGSQNNAPAKHQQPNNINRIPDIVFTGVDEHQSKMGLLSGSDYPITPGMFSHELGSEYFPGDELKVNLGLEELQMLEDSHITDPVMEQLDSL
nr:CREB-regulated transcription coactivator 1-like isoform X1 [Ciona intestinalis]|eukprot:XP_018667315.1 CREB-regulated transcription coactivator 1-like isoform X1 [Ciona intestinalis]